MRLALRLNAKIIPFILSFCTFSPLILEGSKSSPLNYVGCVRLVLLNIKRLLHLMDQRLCSSMLKACAGGFNLLLQYQNIHVYHKREELITMSFK